MLKYDTPSLQVRCPYIWAPIKWTSGRVALWQSQVIRIIKVRDLKSPGDLANYLKLLSNNETEYNKYLKWKYEGFQFPPSYYSSPIGKFWELLDQTGYCRICERLVLDSGFKKEAMKQEKMDARKLKLLLT